MRIKILKRIPIFVLFMGLIMLGGCESKYPLNLFSGDPTPTEFLTRDAAYYKEVRDYNEKDITELLSTTGKEIYKVPWENDQKAIYILNDFSWGKAGIEFHLQGNTVVAMWYTATIRDIRSGSKKYNKIKETQEKLSIVTGSDPQNTNVRGGQEYGWSYADTRDNAFICLYHDVDLWSGNPEFTMTVTISFSQKSGQQTPPKKSSPQNVFTVVYANSDDGFVNVRSKPSASGEVLAQLYGSFHGLGDGVLVEKGESWSKVSVGGVTGWCNNRYLGYITWYEGNGGKILVSNKNNTPIYGDDLSGEERYPIFAYIPIDVIIADKYIRDGNYYVLVTGGDALRVSIHDVYMR